MKPSDRIAIWSLVLGAVAMLGLQWLFGGNWWPWQAALFVWLLLAVLIYWVWTLQAALDRIVDGGGK